MTGQKRWQNAINIIKPILKTKFKSYFGKNIITDNKRGIPKTINTIVMFFVCLFVVFVGNEMQLTHKAWKRKIKLVQNHYEILS